MPVKLGVTVVYLVSPENEGLLRLHLAQIARCTTLPYRIYGSATRLAPEFRPLLDRDDVNLVSLPDMGYRGAMEHSYYLKALIEAALADGCSHVCQLHVDSFPVRVGWDAVLLEHVERGAALAAVLRAENYDLATPSSSGLFFPAEFYRTYGPVRWLAGETADDPEFEAFRLGHTYADSCIIWSYWLQRHRLPWHRLLRSNSVNDDPCLGGLFEDLIFHLGAHAGEKWSLWDYQQSSGMQRWRHLRRLIPTALKTTPLFQWISYRERRTRMAQNEATFDLIRDRLLADPAGYLDYLRGYRAQPPPVASRSLPSV